MAGDRLLEREGELAAAGGLLAAARAGSGRLLLIEGPAGIGKSSLLEEARSGAAPLGFRVLAARGGELERDFAFGVVRQLLEPCLVRADAAERERLLSGAAALARVVFDPAAEDIGVDAPHMVLHGLYWLVANLAEQSPLLLAVDDGHWVDGPSLRFLLYLSGRLSGLPVALLVTRRTGEPSPAPELLNALVVAAAPPVLKPRPLSGPGVHELVRTRLGSDASEELSRACLDATGGNGFLLTEMLHELQAAGRPAAELDPSVVGRLAVDRIATAILLRVGRLHPSAPGLARAIAVLGESAELEPAAALADLEPTAAASLADSLADAGVLAPGRPLRFVHPIVRTAVYDEIAHADRAALHARAARLLAEAGASSDAVAVHLLATDPAARSGTVDLLRQAAQEATARGAPDAAARYLRRALAEPPAVRDRAEVLLELGIGGTRSGQADALELLREAFRLADSPPVRGRAAIELATALAASCTRAPEAISALESARESAEDPEQVHFLDGMLGGIAIAAPSARTHLAALHERAQEDPSAQGRPVLAPLAADLAVTGANASAVAKLAERALAGGELMRLDIASEAPFAMTAIWALVHAGRFGPAKRAMDEGIALARRRGSPLAVARLSACRSFLYHRLGDLATAEADARTTLDLSPERGWGIVHSNATAILGSVLVERGDLTGAREVLGEPPADPDGDELIPNQILREARADLRLAEGDAAAALAELDACERWERDWQLGPGVVPVAWRSRAALARLRMGDAGEAIELARREVELARAFGAAPPVGRALRSLGIVEGGEPGVERLREAVSVLEGSSARLEHAAALVGLGTLLRLAGQRTESRGPLRAGMELAHRCGASAMVVRARQELQLSGARPRRIALSGRDALTPGERRVADLAAGGMSNKQIAQALFVTLRTVEMHLSNAYRKLGIRSREGLGDALRSAA
jgi:DNA-binding CsgD family transcriptional regulator